MKKFIKKNRKTIYTTCDRCQNFFELTKSIKRKEIKSIKYPPLYIGIKTYDRYYTLCPECNTKLENWLKSYMHDVILDTALSNSQQLKMYVTDNKALKIIEDTLDLIHKLSNIL